MAIPIYNPRLFNLINDSVRDQLSRAVTEAIELPPVVDIKGTLHPVTEPMMDIYSKEFEDTKGRVRNNVQVRLWAKYMSLYGHDRNVLDVGTSLTKFGQFFNDFWLEHKMLPEPHKEVAEFFGEEPLPDEKVDLTNLFTCDIYSI